MALKPVPNGLLRPNNQGTRVLGTTKAVASRTQTTEKVNIATLVRGRTYAYQNEFFYLDKPRTVTRELGKILEDLKEVVTVGGEEYDAYLFRVEFDTVPLPDLDDDENNRPQRNVLPTPKRQPSIPLRRPVR